MEEESDARPPNNQQHDAALVERASLGDRDAFAALVEAQWPSLVALARSVLVREADAEDVVQEAVIDAWQKLQQLRSPQAFPSWLRRIVARRCFRSAHRFEREMPLADHDWAVSAHGSAHLDVPRLLALLSPRQRAVLVVCEIEGHSDREAARSLGMSVATVRVHRWRALRRLRALVAEDRGLSARVENAQDGAVRKGRVSL